MTATTARPRAVRGGQSPRTARRRGPRQFRGAILALTLPFVLLFLFVYVAPVIYATGQSFFSLKTSALGFEAPETVFVGFDNYSKALNSGEFWGALGRILLFGVVQVPLMLGVALGLALLLDSLANRWVSVYRVIYFLPYAIPGVIAAVLWSYLYSPSLSPLVDAGNWLGVNLDFLAPSVVLWSMANITTWVFTGYNMLILLSALQAIPRDQLEAARIDGASEVRIARSVKTPQIRPALVLTGVNSIIGTIQLFNEPQVMRVIADSVNSSYTPTMLAMGSAFVKNDYGYAAAVSVLLALVAGLLSLVYYRVAMRRAE
ncbi:sugar ABC transporter permease [Kineosporia sp. NBRC 101677]|uniref:carbohydrate ABC transporter permease n=1 Tax=Kineosporia sp. NBRC 101677 TaxID=3032197 RepID=UPI0024A5A4AE|nr:sugar ABC transporter permease [Kineosporia sp. NBRC 101677]GLY16652.1 sugar ABC transporter permease [Kineosporia sp. NBRC 101677]